MKVKVGDTVTLEAERSFCTAGDKLVVTALKTKYNEDTGEPYGVICCGDQEFDEETGAAITEPTAYYIIKEE